MKYYVKNKLFSALIILLIAFKINSDIPVHCLKSQIIGGWTLYTTNPEEKNLADLYNYTCGHKLPSHESSAYIFNLDKQLFVNKYFIELKETDEALMKSYNEKENSKLGKWTMVYDEGFDITFDSSPSALNQTNFFVFSKYSSNKNQQIKTIKSKWASHCYSTLIGWFYTGNKWGCFYAEKKVDDPNIITNGEAENKLNVLENQITSRDNNNNNEGHTFSTVNIFFEKQDTQTLTEPDIIDNIKNESNFLESKSRSKLTLHAKFKDHSKFVERINSMNGMWKAENYDNFSTMTLEELNRFAGRKRATNRKLNLLSGKNIYIDEFKDYTTQENVNISIENKFIESSMRKLRKINNKIKDNSQNVEETKLPDQFLEYKKFMSDPRSQGNCGSCFAASTLSMLEARIRKAYPDLINNYFTNSEDFALSLKHVLECSVYNQGCDGGYSYLVLKFYKEFQIVLKNCYAKGCQKDCKDPKLNELEFTITNFGYVGGSYGKCDEKQIMKEVYLNGPIVLSLEPDYSFMFYKSGIYQSPISSWITNKTKRPEWEKVDHSMVLVGWGIENINGKSVKYWLLQNSWGSAWGDNGYIKFIRGIDHLGIESICEYGLPVPKIKENPVTERKTINLNPTE